MPTQIEPALFVGLAWLLFLGSHIGFAASGLRRSMGQERYVLAFITVASLSFSLLVASYAVLKDEGAAGLGVVSNTLFGVVVVSVLIISASLGIYPKSPMAQTDGSAPGPTGFARITRHGFMVGTILFAGAHALMATHLTGVVFFGGFAVLAFFGSLHQDRRLLRERGAAYAAYLESTSFFPFWAIVRGRQRLELNELPWLSPIVGLAAIVVLRTAHPHLFDAFGLPFAAMVLAPAWFFTCRGLVEARAAAH